MALAALAATGIGAAQTVGPNGADREPNFRSLRDRADIKFLPLPLQEQLLELARRPHPYLPLTVFGEADEPSQRAWVLSGFLTLVQPAVRASVPQDADLR
jgi:hypothetical protein